MAKLYSTSFDSVCGLLPDIKSWEPGDGRLVADIFVCALGFEPRGLKVPERLAALGAKVSRAIYIVYKTNVDDNEANRARLVAALSSIGGSVQAIEVDSVGFPSEILHLIESVRKEGRDPTVWFDISVAANRLILRCLKPMLEADIELKIVYAEAESYSPTKEAYELNAERLSSDEDLGLEQGVSDVVIGAEYAGNHIDQLPDCVILFPSFNRARATAVISTVDPSLLGLSGDRVIWLLGKPHLEADHWRLGAMRQVNRLTEANAQYEVSTFDYKDTLERLQTIYDERSLRVKFTLSPMGSKLQAVASSMFLYMHPDVRVMFAIPREYRAGGYSKGAKAVWQIEIGQTAKLRAALDNVGQLRVES